MTGAHELGRMVAELKGKWSAGGWLIYVGFLMIAAGIANLVSAFKEAASLLEVMTIGIPLLLICWAIGGVLLYVSAARWRQTVTIYELGFQHDKLIGGRTVHFADVTGVEHVISRSRSGYREHVYFDLAGGKRYRVSDLAEAQTLASMANSVAQRRAG